MANEVIMAPVHHGEILLAEFLEPLGLSQYQLAKSIAVPARRINEIVHGKRRISADTALRLSRFFGTSERFWMNLQARYDLESRRTSWARRSTTSSPTPSQLDTGPLPIAASRLPAAALAQPDLPDLRGVRDHAACAASHPVRRIARRCDRIASWSPAAGRAGG